MISPGCAPLSASSRAGGQRQRPGAGPVGLAGQLPGVQHGAAGVEHGGVSGNLVAVLGAEAGSQQPGGEAAHHSGRAASALGAEPYDAGRTGRYHGAGATAGARGEGARLLLAGHAEAGDDHRVRADGGDGPLPAREHLDLDITEYRTGIKPPVTEAGEGTGEHAPHHDVPASMDDSRLPPRGRMLLLYRMACHADVDETAAPFCIICAVRVGAFLRLGLKRVP
jgi:hypothetical protein